MATKFRSSKFCPPLKKAELESNISQDSCTSWSLPPTQTRTVLSYCECDDEVNRPDLEAPKKKRNYSIYPRSVRKKAIPSHTNTISAIRKPVNDVYEYSLTPTATHKNLRTKEQVSLFCMRCTYAMHVS